jgi:PAB1-binding protein PBP1
LRKTHNKKRIASFQHKQKICTLDAKPEMKRKAHAEVKKRVKKTIEKISEHKRKAEATKKENKLTASTTQRGDDNNKGGVCG